MPFGAALKVNVSGKVSREANYSSKNWRAASEGSCWNLHSLPKAFEAPLKHPTYLEYTEGYVNSEYMSSRKVQHAKQSLLTETGKNTFPAKY